MKKLSTEEFIDALYKGKGRASMYVRDNGDQGIADVLLHGCLHDLGYDPQCEGDRGRWMYQMIEHTKNSDFYYQHIAAQFLNNTALWNVVQQSTMLTLLAKRNYPKAKTLLYQKFNQQQFNESWVIGQNIIELDGIEGLLHVAEVLGNSMLSKAEYCEDSSLLEYSADLLGRKRVFQALLDSKSRNVKEYMDHLDKTAKRLKSLSPALKKSTPLSIQEFLTTIAKMPVSQARVYGSKFAQTASAQDIDRLFNIICSEASPELLLRYLLVFRHIPMPKLPNILLTLVESSDENLSTASLDALANIQDVSVRNLAIKLLDQGRLDGLKLLVKNFHTDDFVFVSSKLGVPNNTDEAHWQAMDLLELCGQHNHSGVKECLLWVYEHTPCSDCRAKAIQKLIAIKSLSRPLKEECRHDCNKDITQYFL